MQTRLTGPGILRLYLAIIVVLQHLAIIHLGGTAVFLFFVMSGFWITALWSRKYLCCRQPYLTFLISRYWRLFPLYIICSLMMMMAEARFSAQFAELWSGCFSNVSLPVWVLRTLLIVSSASQPYFLPPTWSLDIEMQFYLVAPMIIWVLALLARKGAVVTCCFAAILGGISLWLLFHQSSISMHLGSYLVFFIIGSLIHHLKLRPGSRLALCGIVLYLLIIGLLRILPLVRPILSAQIRIHDIFLPYLLMGHQILAAFCFLPAIAYCLGQPSDARDRFFGDFAYPVYLFHEIPINLVDWIYRLHSLGGVICLVLKSILIVAGALALYHWIDRPIDKMRRNFVNRRYQKPRPGLPESAFEGSAIPNHADTLTVL